MTNTVTIGGTELYCVAGQHTWTRPPQRGRPPLNCPEHKNQIAPVRTPTSSPVTETKQAQEPVKTHTFREVASVVPVQNSRPMHVKGTKKAIDARDASTQCNLVLGTNMFKICEARKTVELVEIVVKNGNRFDHHTYTPNEKVLVTPYEPDPQDTK